MDKERRQGFFWVLKVEMVCGLSPGQVVGKLLLPCARKAAATAVEEPKELAPYAPDKFVAHSGSLHPGGEALVPLMEGTEVAKDSMSGEVYVQRN